jgi:MSHA biogenesis protein MshI
LFSFLKKKSRAGVLGLEVSDQGLSLAVAKPDSNGQLQITACFSKKCGKSEYLANIKSWVSENNLSGFACHIVLSSSQYKTFPIEKPQVEDAELTDAVRWKVKDLLDYPIDEAVIDVFEFPSDALRGRPEQVSVVSSRAAVIQPLVTLIDDAGLTLLTIDVVDLALRNVASRLVENDNQTAALLYLRAGNGMIVLIKNKTLYFSRHFDFSLEALNNVEQQDNVIQHLALEVQRSFDYFDSQMGQVPPQILYLIGPTPQIPLANMLGGSISAQVKVIDMSICFGDQHKTTQDDINGFLAMGSALKEGLF